MAVHHPVVRIIGVSGDATDVGVDPELATNRHHVLLDPGIVGWKSAEGEECIARRIRGQVESVAAVLQ